MKKIFTAIMVFASLFVLLSINPVFAKTEKEMLSEGEQFVKKGQFIKAIEHYTKIIEQYPNSSEAYFNRGVGMLTGGDFKSAISDFSNAIKINPKYEAAYFCRGACYLLSEEYEKSIADNKKVIEMNPESSISYYNIGAAYGKMMDYPNTIKFIDKAIEMEPKVAEYYSTRGKTYFEMGNMKSSAEDFKKACELKPDYAYSHLQYALSLMKQGGDGISYINGYLDKEKETAWPLPVFKMFAEKITPEACLKSSESTDADLNKEQKCEALFYIGEFYLLKDDRQKAKEYFSKCISTGVNYFCEYYFSKAELKRMEGSK
jgi:tetratricopeptide (TPR) repeat protein